MVERVVRNLAGADLTGTDFAGEDLRGANLTGANLRNSTLRGADLTGADLTGAKLRCADFEGADFTGANLSKVHLRMADLYDGADLTGADLTGADLTGADLRNSNLARATLTGADLTGAELTGAYLTGKYITGVIMPYPEVPVGELTGWKKCKKEVLSGSNYLNPWGNYLNAVIAELRIPADARRLVAAGTKLRAEHANVISLACADGTFLSSAVSLYDGSFTYTAGERVTASSFNEDRWNECSGGIHFFLDREEALRWTG